MAYDVFQTIGVSETGRGKTHGIKVPYVVLGTDRQDVARDLIFRHVGPRVYGMKLENIEVTETGPSQWEGSVDLKALEKKENIYGLQSISFDTGGGNMTVQTGKLIGSFTADDRTPTDYGGAINIKNDGEQLSVDGIDILLPTLKFSETWNFPASRVSANWVKGVSSVTGTVNAGGFRSFQRGEVLFQGVTGSYSKPAEGEEPVATMTFNFDCSQNISRQQVGGVTVPYKRGWDVISVIYRMEADLDNYDLRPHVAQVDIIEVYKYTNFGLLGI
tara:strand:- start:2065 stop:2886 length:822 start_codon:yes stop_codon:yes gene_type:complete